MSDFLLAASALFAAGALPALAIAGRRAEALPLSVLVAALLCALGGMASVVAGGSALAWSAGAAVAANTGALLVLRSGRQAAGSVYGAAQLAVLVMATLPLVALRRPAIDWDSRSIWSFHARWFYAGGSFVERALGNPAFEFSHADYPPAIPATVGVAWEMLGGINANLGQAVTGILNWAAVTLIGIGVSRLLPGRSLLLGGSLGVVAAVGSFGVAGVTAANGYADLLWAAGIAAGVVYLLLPPRNRVNLTTGLVALTVAGLTKNEGMVIALPVLVMAGIRHRPRGGWLGAFAACAFTVLLWPLLARAFGAGSDLSDGVRQALAGKSDIGSRVVPTLSAMTDHLLPFLVAAAVCTLFGSLYLRGTRHGMSMGSPLWTWGAAGFAASFIAFAYLVSPNDLSWHLATSVDRTTIGLKILLLVECLGWAAAALESLLGSNYTTVRSEAPSEFSHPLHPRTSGS